MHLDVIEIAERQAFRAEGTPHVGIRTVNAILMPAAFGEVPIFIEYPGGNKGSVPVEHQCLEVKSFAFAQMLFLQGGAALASDPAHALANQLLTGGVVSTNDLACYEHVERAGIARGLTDHCERL